MEVEGEVKGNLDGSRWGVGKNSLKSKREGIEK